MTEEICRCSNTGTVHLSYHNTFSNYTVDSCLHVSASRWWWYDIFSSDFHIPRQFHMKKEKKTYRTKLFLLLTVNTLSLLSIIEIIKPTLAYLLPFLYNLSPNAYVNVLWQLNTECQTSGTPHWPNKFRFIQDILC